MKRKWSFYKVGRSKWARAFFCFWIHFYFNKKVILEYELPHTKYSLKLSQPDIIAQKLKPHFFSTLKFLLILVNRLLKTRLENRALSLHWFLNDLKIVLAVLLMHGYWPMPHSREEGSWLRKRHCYNILLHQHSFYAHIDGFHQTNSSPKCP